MHGVGALADDDSGESFPYSLGNFLSDDSPLGGSHVLAEFAEEYLRVYLGEEMRGRGIDIRGSTHVARIDKTVDGYTVTTTAGDKIKTDCVMYATGRKPNTDGLGLAEIGVEEHELPKLVEQFNRIVDYVAQLNQVLLRLGGGRKGRQPRGRSPL